MAEPSSTPAAGRSGGTGGTQGSRRTPTGLLWLLAVVLLLGGGAGGWWLWGGAADPGGDAPQAQDAPVDPTAPTDEDDPLAHLLPDALGYEEDTAEARRAADTLAGITGDEDIDENLAAGTREAVPGVDGALPQGTVLTPLLQTWARRGNIAAMLVEVEPPGVDAPDVFLVWLVRDPQDQDAWLLSSTERLDGPVEDLSGEGAG